MRFDWDDLRIFKTAAELHSMNSAAQALGVSAPQVTRKIAQLERDLNAVLFTRSTRGVQMTQAGKMLLQHACAMQDAADAVYLDVADSNEPVEGIIRLVTGDGLGPYWIAPRLPELHRTHPHIEVHFSVALQKPDLMTEDTDIAIVFEEPSRHDWIARRLGVLHYMCFASKEYLSLYGRPSSIFDFTGHKCIMHTDYVHQVERWAPKMPELRKLIDFSLITNSGTAMANVCANGGGVAIMPSYMAAADPRLVPLELPTLAPIQFWLTYTSNLKRQKKGKVLIDWLIDQFDRNRIPWFRDTFTHPNEIVPVEPVSAE